ncbi:MAG: fumarylacetoacetate hydrolase [Actinobacteria bacterium]|nr:fumarylacetoacetate hydrolase [Actinomycetota bacterium]
MAFIFANVDGRSSLISGGSYFDLEQVSNGAVSVDPMEAIRHSVLLHAFADRLDDYEPSGVVDEVKLGAPVPEPRNCYGIGLNYQLHVDEASMKTPSVPMVFTKFPSCITGPDADVMLRSDQCDYEGELVIVIGKKGKDITERDAWGHILGFTVGQDFSDRSVQFKDDPPQFNLGKSFDTFGPIGPFLVSIDTFHDPADLEILTRVNGVIRQRDRTSNMIFRVPELVAYLSTITSLATGDIIFSGTPEGVGFRNGFYLQNGDVVETIIEGIGTMTNTCVRGSDFA